MEYSFGAKYFLISLLVAFVAVLLILFKVAI